MKVYYPILKWKAGEQKALCELSNSHKDAISPILEIVDQAAPSKILDEIKSNYPSRQVYVDTKYSDDDDRSFLEQILLNAFSRNQPICPVFYAEDILNPPISILEKATSIVIRIPIPEDIDNESYDSIFKSLIEIYSDYEIDINILFDLDSITDQKQARYKLSELKTAIRDYVLPHTFWQHIIIASTSFPDDLSTIAAGQDFYIDRHEIKIFKKILTHSEFSSLKLKLIYSDYGVTRFTDTEIDFSKLKYGILPKARYSLEDQYWILKGKRDHQTKQFTRSHLSMAQDIYNSPHYYGNNFSYGDMEIKERALQLKGPGNNTNWVTIAANHHIVVSINVLSNPLVP